MGILRNKVVKNSMPDNNLCKKCRHRFRRVFIPLIPEQYEDDEGRKIFSSEEENIIIMNTCLIAGIDIESEMTMECDHFENHEKIDEENISIFKHLK